jgi:5-hydroxyisourate hydrolase
VSHDRPTISTHVLDTAAGSPRAGVRVRLLRLAADGAGTVVGEALTDDDGRIRDLLGGGRLDPGAYRLEFSLDPDGFFSGLGVEVRIDDVGRSYHVPLLLSPFGLTTYRGS